MNNPLTKNNILDWLREKKYLNVATEEPLRTAHYNLCKRQPLRETVRYD